MTDRKRTFETSHLAQSGETPLSHQERVYFEMFRGIEMLGRKLEKSEAIREELARRLSDLEASAARDAATGKYYLPAKIEPANLPAATESLWSRRVTLAASVAGLALGVIALGLVLTQHAPQTLSPRQLAALNNLAAAQEAPVFADHAGGGWHKLQKTEQGAQTAALSAPAAENVTAEVLEEPPAMPSPFVLAASLEAMKEAEAENALPEDMAQGDADPDADVTAAAESGLGRDDLGRDDLGQGDLGHDDLAALVAQENAADSYDAEAKAFAQAEDQAATVVPETVALKTADQPAPELASAAAKKNVADAAPAKPVQSTAYTSEPLRDPYLPSVYADLERRAYDGIAEAQHDLAALYAAGGRVRPDYPRAVYWFRRAADAGIANAYYNLGVMAQQGIGMAKDAGEAFAFYSRAARLGHPEAMYNLGLAYIEGRGTAKDNLRGISYFKKAANAGLTQAAYNLGVIYEGGSIEGHRDLKAALEWYHVAAVEGHAEAEAAIRRVEKRQMQAEALTLSDKVEPAAGR